MSTLDTAAPARLPLGAKAALAGAAGLLCLVSVGALTGRAPRFELIGQASPAIQIHFAAVVLAFATGAVQLLGPKGTAAHRTIGWTWSLAMMAAALSSFFVRSSGGFSPIHILSVTTLIGLPLGLFAAHRHKVSTHAKTMTSIYLGGMVIAGGFAFLPGRLMWAVFFG